MDDPVSATNPLQASGHDRPSGDMRGRVVHPHGAPIGNSFEGALSALAIGAGGPGEPMVGLRLRTLIALRWVAAIGQATALAVVYFGFGFELPLTYAAVVVTALAMSNVAVSMIRAPTARLGDREGAFYLAFDVAQLTMLLFLTGGLHNPFSFLLITPVVIGAIALTSRSMSWLGGFALLCVLLLNQFSLPMPWVQGELILPPLYAHGTAIAIIVALLFVTVFAWVVANNARRMAKALGATEMALAREQRMAALGALSAAVAHELGTPLATIAVSARELRRELPDDSPLAEEAAALVSETQRCREILTSLAQDPEHHGTADDQSPSEQLSLQTLLELAASSYRDSPRPGQSGAAAPVVAIWTASSVVNSATGDQPTVHASLNEPIVRPRPELLHGLGNLIQNAVQFAESKVDVSAVWDADQITITVVDDGPGFSFNVLGNLGEPYISERAEEGHLGLGVFIAKTLLEFTGAKLRFRNVTPNGAKIVATWARDKLDRRIADQPSSPMS